MADERIRYVLSAVDETRGAFASVRSNLDGIAKSLRSVTSIGGGVFGAVVLNEVRQAGAALLDARIQSEKLGNTLSQAVGSAGVGREIGFIRQQADRLGLAFDSTAQSYAKFAAASRGTSLEGQQTREIFVGIAQASAALGLSSEETAGALTAVQQIISKGKVSAEELRGQLGERLPGAFQIAARSIGVTTQELDALLQSGSLLADDFLPRFARQLQTEFADAAQRAAGSTQASLNKLETAWNDLKRTLGDGIAGDALKTGIDQTTVAVQNLEKATKRAEENSGSWLENLLELTRLLPGVGAQLARVVGDRAVDVGRAAGLSTGQDDILTRRARELGARADGSTVTGLRRLDNQQGAALDAQARADVRKLLDQFRSPQQRLSSEISELRRLGALTGTDVSGAIAEARRRAAGATVDMAKAYAELDAQVRQADLDDTLKQEAESTKAFAAEVERLVEQLSQYEAVEIRSKTEALGGDLKFFERVAQILKDLPSKQRAAAEALTTYFDNRFFDGLMSEEDWQAAIDKVNGITRTAKDDTTKLTDAARELGLTFESSLEDAIVKFEDLRTVARGFLQDVLRIGIREGVTKPFASALIGDGKSPGLLTEFLGSIGFRAAGGPIAAGRPYIVGEKGAELIVPRSNGMVIPAGGFGGGVQVQVPLMVTDSMSRAATYDLIERAKREVYETVGLALARGPLGAMAG